MSIVLQSSGGGSVTINEPTTASNLTATLPAATGTVMVSGNMPAFIAINSGNQTVTNNTSTKLAVNSEQYDTNNNYDPTTNYRFTPTSAGYYQINGGVSFQYGGSSSPCLIAIYKNGSLLISGSTNPSATSFYPQVFVNSLVYANGSTDYFELYATQNTGSSQVAYQMYFNGCMVRSA